MGEKKKKIKKNKRKEKRKKKPHFRGTFQNCKSEVKQLQMYIDNNSLGFFFFFWNSNRVEIEYFS